MLSWDSNGRQTAASCITPDRERPAVCFFALRGPGGCPGTALVDRAGGISRGGLCVTYSRHDAGRLLAEDACRHTSLRSVLWPGRRGCRRREFSMIELNPLRQPTPGGRLAVFPAPSARCGCAHRRHYT